MKGIEALVTKARELKASGMNNKEIGRDLLISVETVNWLLTRDVKAEAPPQVDFNIGWKSIGVYGHRISYLTEILSDILMEECEKNDIECDTVVGISIYGIPIASYMSAELGLELAVYRPAQVENAPGNVVSNLATVEGKKVVIVDDFIGSGETMQNAVKDLQAMGANPVLGLVVINKTDKTEILGVPMRSLIRARTI